MSDEKKVPPEDWIPHPVSDHGDLDRPAPEYTFPKPKEKPKNG